MTSPRFAKSIWLAGCLSLLLGLAPPSSDNQLYWQTLAELEFPRDTRVAFEEARKTRLQRVEKIQSGHLWLTSAGDLAMEIEVPRAELRKIQGSTLSLQRGDKIRSTTLNPERGAHQLLLAVVDVLRGDVVRLQENFVVTVNSQTDLLAPSASESVRWVFELQPKAAALRSQMSALILSGTGRNLTSLRTERGSSYQQITILKPPPIADGKE